MRLNEGQLRWELRPFYADVREWESFVPQWRAAPVGAAALDLLVKVDMVLLPQ